MPKVAKGHRRILRILVTCLLVCAAAMVSLEAQDQSLVGVWSTDAVATAQQDRDKRQQRKYSDGFGAPDVPRGGFGGGGGGFGGGSGGFGGAGIEKGGTADGVALVITFKLDGTRLVGKVKEFVTGNELEIEEFTGAASTFEFRTYKKVGSVKVGTTYRGQRLDDGTIAIERLNPAGKHIDMKVDGTPDTLIFRRSTIPAPPLPPSLPSPGGRIA